MNVSHPLNAIKAFLSRFIIYPSEHELIAHTAWIVHTHLMDEWDTTPRLAFLSSEPASGKSRALEVTAQLVPRAIEPVNASPAYLFRRTASTEGRPTILHDEIDTVFGPKAKDNEDVRGFINAGYRKHSKYGRCVGNKSGQFTTEDIPAFCAVAVAGLGNLPDTILSRSVIVRMKRRAPHEAIEPFRVSKFEAEASAIRQHIEQWASQHKDLLANMKPLSNFFTALVCSSISLCGGERHLRRSTHGSRVLFFMFETDRRAGKVKKTQTHPLAPIVTVSPQR